MPTSRLMISSTSFRRKSSRRAWTEQSALMSAMHRIRASLLEPVGARPRDTLSGQPLRGASRDLGQLMKSATRLRIALVLAG